MEAMKVPQPEMTKNLLTSSKSEVIGSFIDVGTGGFQQQVMKEPQQVTTKDPKKIEAGKRLAAINHKKREVKKREEQAQLERTTSGVNQYYGIRAVIALGVIGSLGYYIYQSRKGPAPREVTMPVSQQPCP